MESKQIEPDKDICHACDKVNCKVNHDKFKEEHNCEDGCSDCEIFEEESNDPEIKEFQQC